MHMAPEAEPAGGKKTSWEYLPYLVIVALGAILLLVANTDGVGNSRWRYLLYFFMVLLLSLAILYTYGVRKRIRFGKMFSLALGLFVALILLSALSLIWGETTFEGTKALMLLLAFALSMARVALADRDVTPEEVAVIRKALSNIADLSRGEIDFVMHLILSHAECAEGRGAPHLRSLSSAQRESLTAALHAVGEADGQLTAEERGEIDRIVAEMNASS